MPKYLFDKGLVSASDKLREQAAENYGKPETLNLEKELFFTYLMSADCLSDKEKEEQEQIEILKDYLASGTRYTGNNERVIKAIRVVAKLSRLCSQKGSCSQAVSDILNDPLAGDNLRAVAEQLNKSKITCRPSLLTVP